MDILIDFAESDHVLHFHLYVQVILQTDCYLEIMRSLALTSWVSSGRGNTSFISILIKTMENE